MTHILLVEDDPDLSRVLELSLIRQGYTVDVQTNGRHGFEQAMNAQFDAIVLDWTLPEMTGIEVCRQLRANSVHTPIIMLTGRSAEKDRISGLDMGADDYLTKPFSSDELYARLRALLRRKSSSVKEQVLRVQNLTFHTATQEVFKDEQPIHLMPKELELLQYFMQHPSVTLPRAQILQDVWGVSVSNSSNRLDVHVANLRRKIGATAENKLLQTVRNIGYRMQAD